MGEVAAQRRVRVIRAPQKRALALSEHVCYYRCMQTHNTRPMQTGAINGLASLWVEGPVLVAPVLLLPETASKAPYYSFRNVSGPLPDRLESPALPATERDGMRQMTDFRRVTRQQKKVPTLTLRRCLP